MSRATDPKLFAESLCKFHAGWLTEDTRSVVGLAVMKVILFHSSAPLTAHTKVVQENRRSQQPPHEWEAGGQLVKAFSRCSRGQ